MFPNIENRPSIMTIEYKETMKRYFLREHQMSSFELDFNLWLKLRQMEECQVHIEFNMFVRFLENKLFKETFPSDDISEQE